MELTAQKICELIQRSGLLPAEQAQALYQRWHQAKGTSERSADDFAAWICAQGYITVYQAKRLAHGRRDGFFLNEYKILDRIGRDGMGRLYKAQHHLGQIVEIGVLSPSRASDPALLSRFQRDAALALRLQHPNIVRTFQTGLAEGVHYVVREHLEGLTLDEVLRQRGKLSPEEAVRLVHQALAGLQHLHNHGLIHGDLKPAGLLLLNCTPQTTVQATVKIRHIGSADDQTLPTAYTAPELRGAIRSGDIRADIYSMGCILYRLLSGQRPFGSSKAPGQASEQGSAMPRPLRDFNSTVPEGLQQIVNWMLAKDPAQRYPTPLRAAQALELFLVAGGAPLAVPEGDAGMQSYLRWLQGQPQRQTGLPIPASPQAPGIRLRDTESTSASPAPAAPEALPEIDVELVDPSTMQAPMRRLPLANLRPDRRDLLYFALGAVGGSLAAFVGCVAALRLRRDRAASGEEKGGK